MTGRTAIGWPVIEPDALNTCRVQVQGGVVTLRLRPGDTCTILMDLVRRFDATVEPVYQGLLDDWSYAKRPVRESSNIWSEHASGTAIDLNATQHPRGVRGTFTPAQRKAINALLEFYSGAVAFGGNFHTTVDEMHWEITVPPGDPLIKATAHKVRTALEDGMPTPEEIAEAVWQKITHKTFTGDESGEQLDNRTLAGVDLVGSRAALSLQNAVARLATRLDSIEAKLDHLIGSAEAAPSVQPE